MTRPTLRSLVSIAFLALLIAWLGGCDSGPGGGDGQAPPEGRTVEGELPDGRLEAMLARVDRGEWSIEEGIIAHLKVQAGEAKLEDYYGEAAPEGGEGSDFITLAQHYLHDGDDPEAKHEIERLLRIIFPDVETLKRHSRPVEPPPAEPQGSLGMPALAAVGDALVRPARADAGVDCAALHEKGFEGGEDPDDKCFNWFDWSHLGETHYVFYPIDWTDGPKERYARVAQATINDALDAYRRVGAVTVKDIKAVFITLDDGSHATTNVRFIKSSYTPTECRIRIRESAFDESRAEDTSTRSHTDAFRQTMAHEVFHCIHKWNMFAQSNGAAGLGPLARGRINVANDWWTEGAATYFANVVLPCVNSEWFRRADDFDRESVDHSLMHMDYGNFVFFQYFANERGRGEILRLIESMPTSGSFDEQAAALAGYPDIAELFHEFGRNYLDRDIADECPGRKVRVKPETGEALSIHKGRGHEVDAKRFHLARRRVRFGGGEYDLVYDPPGDPAKAGVKQEGAEWREPPARVNAGCSDKEHQLLVTFALGSPEESTYTIEEIGEDLAREHHIDRCLVGRWASEAGAPETIGRWMARRISRMSQTEGRFNEADGRVLMRFTAGGRIFGETQDLKQSYSYTQDLDEAEIEVDLGFTTNATSCMDYSAEDGTLTAWNIGHDGGSDVHVVMRPEDVPPIEQSYTLPMRPPGAEAGAPDVPPGGGTPGGGGFPGGGMPGGGTPGVGMPGGGVGDGEPSFEMPDEVELTYRCRGDSLEVDLPEEIAPEGMSAPSWRFRRVGGR